MGKSLILTPKDEELFLDLCSAAVEGKASTVAHLLALGVDPDSRPLALAAANGHIDCVEGLASRSTKRARGAALLAAVSNKREDCALFLAPLCSPESNARALDSAASCGLFRCLPALIDGLSGNPDTSEALRTACRNGHIECVRLLIPPSGLGKEPSLILESAASAPNAAIAEAILSSHDFLADDLAVAGYVARAFNNVATAAAIDAHGERLEIKGAISKAPSKPSFARL